MSKARQRSRRTDREIHLPPHCPNRHCRFYRPRAAWKWTRDGFFTRPSDRRRFQRFRCTACGRRFSSRTFAGDYWLRQRALLIRLAELASEGPGLRQSARLCGVAHSTVGRQLARAGRHCLLFHQKMVLPHRLSEPIVIDGFESFEYSQFFPFHFHLAVGSRSWFLYHFTESPLRRKGAMTEEQRARRSELESRLGRPDPKAIEQSVLEILQLLGRRWDWGRPKYSGQGGNSTTTALTLHTDGHPAYRRAIRRVRVELPGQLRHVVTSSLERRTTRNPLFPVNLADLLLRHGQANHRRETIAFSKRRQAALERLAVFTVWRNSVKLRRERQADWTAAMAAGILSKRLSWRQVLLRRQFPSRPLLPGTWWEVYWRRVKTAALGSAQTEHNPKYAF